MVPRPWTPTLGQQLHHCRWHVECRLHLCGNASKKALSSWHWHKKSNRAHLRVFEHSRHRGYEKHSGVKQKTDKKLTKKQKKRQGLFKDICLCRRTSNRFIEKTVNFRPRKADHSDVSAVPPIPRRFALVIRLTLAWISGLPGLLILRPQLDYPAAERYRCIKWLDLLYEEILLYHDKEFYQNYERKKKKGESLIEHILKNSNASLIDPYADTDEWKVEEFSMYTHLCLALCLFS